MSFFQNYKKYLVSGLSIGAGLALVAAVLFGGYYWYNSRPKPWKSDKIKAYYTDIGTEGNDDSLYFAYILENTTEYDYRLTSGYDVNVVAKLARQDSYTASQEDLLKIDYPIFVPAKKKTRILVHLKYHYDGAYGFNPGPNASSDDNKKYSQELEKFVNDKLANLNGFSIFDETKRYEIILPNGWSDNRVMK